MTFKVHKLNDVYRNIIKCNNPECGILYDVEFSRKRFLENHTMNVECPFGHIQTVLLKPVRERCGMMRLSDEIEFEPTRKRVKCHN